ncbi:Tn7 transposase TnsA N-terminal domain-containing protein [Desulfosporosinus shakirovi]|uniref:Tn7 transposase TnsA N-terminal domain-containing protein n=1 Tax=Desulfosporosinus shakirovi TaxID=2885154 RepID=UPI001E335CC4|nr:Tn7 transposase TnsA N-terminal domain-containing protein [Desulfosporosinus sp. SRJS8]MCB8818877.1 Tn7 transposase TnsA N-terminal domain-containing protein [Desulfosporosinus sp. SRJS8]
MPVRKITNKGSKKKIGFFPSEKNGRSIAWESLVERDYMYLLEFDHGVRSFCEQPLSIKYAYEGRTYRYTPDIKIVRNNKVTEIVEVKPKTKLVKLLDDEKFKRKLLVANTFCIQKGYRFKVVTDEDIRKGNLLRNIKLLFKFSRMVVPSADFLKIRNELMVNGTQTIESLTHVLAEDGINQKRIRAMIFSLLYSQKLMLNLLDKVSIYSYIRLP